MTATFRMRLISELTQLDGREETSERRRRYPVNHYRLSHYLHAADDVVAAVAAGATETDAFADAFTPTRGMLTVARRLSLNLDVTRGRWTPRGNS